jgi:hypothetical protein
MIRIPREFFTNLWVFALTDTEIVAFLTLSFLRWHFPGQYAAQRRVSRLTTSIRRSVLVSDIRSALRLRRAG